MTSIIHYKLDPEQYEHMLALVGLQRDYAELCNNIADCIRDMAQAALPDTQKVTKTVLTSDRFNEKFDYVPESGKHKGTTQQALVIPRRYIYLAINRVMFDMASATDVQYSRGDGVDLDEDLATPKINKVSESLNIQMKIKLFRSGLNERLGVPCVPRVDDRAYGVHTGQVRMFNIGDDHQPEFVVVAVVDTEKKVAKK